jgi:hypothetical protein
MMLGFNDHLTIKLSHLLAHHIEHFSSPPEQWTYSYFTYKMGSGIVSGLDNLLARTIPGLQPKFRNIKSSST